MRNPTNTIALLLLLPTLATAADKKQKKAPPTVEEFTAQIDKAIEDLKPDDYTTTKAARLIHKTLSKYHGQIVTLTRTIKDIDHDTIDFANGGWILIPNYKPLTPKWKKALADADPGDQITFKGKVLVYFNGRGPRKINRYSGLVNKPIDKQYHRIKPPYRINTYRSQHCQLFLVDPQIQIIPQGKQDEKNAEKVTKREPKE